jgi:acetolactate synthase-1/2/3 large subunit
VRVDVPIVGDAREVLLMLIEELPVRSAAGWLAHIRSLQLKHQRKQQYISRPNTAQLMPHDVYAMLNWVLNARGSYRVVTDVGQHQMWAAQLIEWRRPRSLITSGGIGTMGYAIPAAIGTALAFPNETIWAICGDGGFQMTNQELATIMQEGITNIKIAVINNGYLGMVRQSQELFSKKRYSGTPLSGPNFAQLAQAYGIRAATVQSIEEVGDAIITAWDHAGPALIDFQIEREVNVFPMVPQDSSLDEMITEAPCLAEPLVLPSRLSARVLQRREALVGVHREDGAIP